MGLAESLYAISLAYAMWATLFAVTGGDVVAITTLMLGAGGVSALGTTFIGLRKQRTESKVAMQSIDQQARTVFAETAESAMRSVGEALTRLREEAAADRKRFASDREMFEKRLAECEDDCGVCRARWEGHASVCPLLKGPPP